MFPKKEKMSIEPKKKKLGVYAYVLASSHFLFSSYIIPLRQSIDDSIYAISSRKVISFHCFFDRMGFIVVYKLFSFFCP